MLGIISPRRASSGLRKMKYELIQALEKIAMRVLYVVAAIVFYYVIQIVTIQLS